MSQGSKVSKESDWRQRRRRLPPARLSWPPSSLSQIATGQSDDDDKKPSVRKRQRQGLDNRSSRKVTSSSPQVTTLASSKMWVEKHAPSTADELCVAPKKVKEVRSWLTQNTASPMTSGKLLILVGSSGIGKSTMIRVLAKELGFFVCDWNESVVPYSRGGSNNYDQLFSIESTSPLQSFEEFLQQSGAGLRSLNLKSSDPIIVAAATPPKSATKTTTTSTTKTPNSVNPTYSKSLILLEDLPHLNDLHAEYRFRNIMENHLRHSRVPTVLIFSDVSEGKHRPKDLERLIDPQQLYSQDVTQIVQIHSVTKPKMKKWLTGIAKRENFQVLSTSSLWDELHEQSRGDLRHAILTMQLESTGHRQRTANNSLKQKNDRDFKLTSFHALGKLLYAKRTTDPISGREILAYDPEDTMERSDMGLGGSIGFLQYHSVDFYSDITDLSKTFELFSDASLMMDYPMDYNRRDTFFPNAYVGSLAGRAVANTNKNPTANKFRQFSSPKIFEIMRKRQHNEVTIQHLFKRLWSSPGVSYASGHEHLSIPSAFGATETLVTDFLPQMRTILPNEVDPSIDTLYTATQPFIQDEGRRGRYIADDLDHAEEERTIREQEEILQLDDIVEDISDSDDSEGAPFIDPAVAQRANRITPTAQDVHGGTRLPSSNVAGLQGGIPAVVQQPEIIVIDDSD